MGIELSLSIDPLNRRRRERSGSCRVCVLVAIIMATGVGRPGECAAEDGVPSEAKLSVHPASVSFNHHSRRRQLVVTERDDRGYEVDRTAETVFHSSNDDVVEISASGVAVAKANGSAVIRCRSGDRSTEVGVEVSGVAGPPSISFRFDLLATLSRASCSSGACHGSPTGKGGFRLSLRGFDPLLDERTLVRQDGGRRVNRFDAERSLMLLKPTMKTAHSGGLRLRAGSHEYELVRDWIASGAGGPPAKSVECLGVELFPKHRVLPSDARRQQLSVWAKFSDGTQRDVTHLAGFASSDEQVANVDRNGVTTGHQKGDATIIAQYLDYFDTASFTFAPPERKLSWRLPTANNWIDEIVFAKLGQLQIEPSPLSSDGEFVRRVYLDVLGVLPPGEAVRQFLADESTDKRARLIDQLLTRPEYAEFWALKWGDLLRVKSSKVSGNGARKFHRWLVRSMRDNKRLDEFAAEILTAAGPTMNHPPAMFYAASRDELDLAESISQLFIGARIQCAKCHNHPFDQWSQDNYYGIAAFFGGVRRTPTRRPGEVLVWLDRAGEVTQPNTGRVMRPWLPGGQPLGADQADPRQALADWLTDSDDSSFSRVAANRIWAHVMGRGVVDPVDDVRATNPPAIPELFHGLGKRLVELGYDQRALLREILNSRVYQLTSRSTASNRADEKYYSHARARLLTAEQLMDAISQVTGVPSEFLGMPPGTRAGQLPAPEFGNDFLATFGQPGRNTVCECERSSEPKLAHALQIINGATIADRLRDPRGRLQQLVNDRNARVAAAGEPPRQQLALWLRADLGVEHNGRPATRGQTVERWMDQSGRARHVEQSADDRRPTLAIGVGGSPAIRFDGRRAMLNHTAGDLFEAAAPRTIFVVAQAAEGGVGGALVTTRRNRPLFAAQHVVVGGKYYVYSDGVNGSGNTTAELGRFAALTKPFVTAFVSPGAGAKLQVSVNGQPLDLSQAGAVGGDGGSATGFSIGGREDLSPGSQAWHGDICEVLAYSGELSEQQRRSVGSYLATKYGLTTSYPVKPSPRTEHRVADTEVVTQFYWAAVSRPPTAAEMAAAKSYIEQSASRLEGLEDICWALLNSKEFLFQH